MRKFSFGFLLTVLTVMLSVSILSADPVINLNLLTPETVCSTGNDTVRYSVNATGIPANTNVVLFQSTDINFNPYLGQGDSIGFIPGNSIPKDTVNFGSCIKTLGIFIDACGASTLEGKNEYIILTSGSGIKVSNLAIDFSSQNNTGGATNADINTGANPCGYKTPTPSLVAGLRAGSCNASNLISASPTDSIPPNAIILLFTSDVVTAEYSVNGLCNLGYPIYVLQSACERTIGAFTNAPRCDAPSRYRTTLAIDKRQNCRDNFTYDLCGIFDINGTYAIRQQGTDTARVSNNGIRRNTIDSCGGIDYTQLNFSADTTLKFRIPTGFCNDGFRYIKAITNPNGVQPISNTIKYKLVCNDVTATSSTTNICSGDSVKINISSTDPNAVLSWTISGGSGVSGAAAGSGNVINQILTYTGNSKDSVVYSVRSDDAGCVKSQAVKVLVNKCETICEATVSIAGNTSICRSDVTTLTAVGYYDSVRWNTNATTDAIQVNQAGSFTATAYKNGCAAVASVSVNQIACNTENDTICAGGSTVLNAPNGYTSYQWSPAIGLNNAGIQQPTASPSITTTYQLIAKRDTVSKLNLVFNGDFELGNIGFNTDLKNIPFFGVTPNSVYNIDTIVNANDPQNLWCVSADHSVNGKNMMIVDGPATPNSNETIWQQTIHVAANHAYRFEAFVMNNHPQVPPVFDVFINGNKVVNSFASATKCQWNQLFGTWNAGAATTATIRIVDNTGVNFGNDFLLDDITLFMVDTVVYKKSITVNVNPLPEPEIIGTTTFCTGESSILNVTGAFDSVRWNTGASTSSIEVAQSGTYSVIAYLNGCSGTTSQQVISNNPPAAFSLGNDTTYCGKFTRILSAGNASTIWNTEETGAQITVTEPGIYIATISNQCGTEIAQIEISQREVPIVNLGNDTAFCENNITLSVPKELEAIWNTGAQDNSIVVTEEGVYTVTVTNEDGCKASDTIVISLVCNNELWLPNAFTPNRDGINDIFYVRGNPKNAVIEKMLIYNRWGNKVFEANDILPDDISTGWNGTYKNQDAQAEVYGYQVLVKFKDGSKKTLKGNVTLLK